MRAAIANKGQRQTSHWQEADIHAHVDHEVAHKQYHQANAEERFKISFGDHGVFDNPPDQQTKERKKESDPDQPPLLGKGCEDKVGLILGQEAQPRLRAVANALAQNLTGTDRDR